jgi:hypothetical protein
VCSRPGAAYIAFPPPTLGELYRQATHIYVVRIEKCNAEKGVILFKPVEALKASLPDSGLVKQAIGSNVKGAKIILDWAAEGKTAVLFANMGNPREPAPQRADCAYVYIDRYWYWMVYDSKDKC